MAQGSFGAFTVYPTDLRKFRDDIVDFLERSNYAINRKTLIEKEIKIEAIRGNKFIAFVFGLIPFMDFLGFGSRVRTTIKCRKSLEEEKDTYRLTIRCEPLMELMDRNEVMIATQGFGEWLGDNLQCRRCFLKFISFLNEIGKQHGS